MFCVIIFFLMLNFPLFLSSVVLDFELIRLGGLKFNFILLFDFFSVIFLWVVLLISTRVFTFRSSYMRGDKYFKRFHYLLFSFVVSIIILILSPNLIRILLGWDGLGISSYLLVIYYSRRKSYNAGMITLISNRVGDALLILRIRYMLYLRNLNIFIIFYEMKIRIGWVLILVVIAGCTKRAQIPFSAWLPAAIAAPTPVSSLVHSSTLVTAGVYLIFRFENLLTYLNINFILLLLGSLTILIARGRAFFEIDIKKMVALSTLRQLGVIITALGAGFRSLGFFHLLTHAFFKALLFVRAGNLIHSSESYQDMRVMGGSSEVLPFTKRIILGASLSLCGLPFMSAFYSKEIIIERLLVYNLSFYRYFILILGILITVFYRFRLLTVALSWVNRQRSLFNKSDLDYTVNFRMALLFIPAITGGRFIGVLIKFNTLFLIPSQLKMLNIVLVVAGVIIFYQFFKSDIRLFNRILWGVGRLWSLPLFSASLPLNLSINSGDFFHKLSDFSWIYYFFTRFYQLSGTILVSVGIVFQKKAFIRRIRNILVLVLLLIIIYPG